MLIVNRRYLETVLLEYVGHNGHRPHRSLGQLPPQPKDSASLSAKDVGRSRLCRTDRLGGLTHEYRLVA